MLTNLINFAVEGVNLDRLLRQINSNNIDLFNLTRSKDKLYFSVKWHSKQKIVDLLDKQCYNYTITGSSGVKSYVNAIKNNFLIYVFAFVLIISCVILNGFVWHIDIYCDKDVDLVQQANAVLSSYNVKVGAPSSRVNLDNLESKLVYQLENVVFAVVKLSGGRLSVMLYIQEDSPILEYSVVDDLVAVSDAIIERIVVISGTAQVKVGDAVIAGQILIKGERTYNDGTTSPVRAAGLVYARAHSKGQVLFENVITEYQETGRSLNYNNLIIFGKEIQSKKAIEFSSYTSQKKYIQMGVLPIKVVNVVVMETRLVSKQVTLEQQLPLLQAKALELAIKECTFNYTSINYYQETINSQIFIVADVSASIEIAKYSKQ